MNSRELVYKTLDFENKGRVPRQIWLNPWAMNRYPEEVAQISKDFPNDIIFTRTFRKVNQLIPGHSFGHSFEVGDHIDQWL